MTWEEACQAQIEAWAKVARGEWEGNEDVRFASLHEDYYETHRTDMGHSVNVLTEELCKGEFKWDPTGTVLVCTECFADGT